MSEHNPSSDIQSTLTEKRLFEPSAAFRSAAYVKSPAEYEALYEEADRDPEGFWGRIASEIEWFQPWKKVLEWDAPWAKWFVGGQLNMSYNCLDKHLTS